MHLVQYEFWGYRGYRGYREYRGTLSTLPKVSTAPTWGPSLTRKEIPPAELDILVRDGGDEWKEEGGASFLRLGESKYFLTGDTDSLSDLLKTDVVLLIIASGSLVWPLFKSFWDEKGPEIVAAGSEKGPDTSGLSDRLVLVEDDTDDVVLTDDFDIVLFNGLDCVVLIEEFVVLDSSGRALVVFLGLFFASGDTSSGAATDAGMDVVYVIEAVPGLAALLEPYVESRICLKSALYRSYGGVSE